MIDLSSARRILIIKLSALGDVVHALPVSAAIGQRYPQAHVAWAVQREFAPLIAGNRYVREIITLPKVRAADLRSVSFYREYVRRLREVRGAGFDVALDLQGLAKSAIVAAASGAKLRIGYHYQREAARLVVRPAPRRDESTHVVDQLLDVARYVDAAPAKVEFPFEIPDEALETTAGMAEARGLRPGHPFVSVNPAAGHPIKQWSAERYGALMDAVQDTLGIAAVLVTADLGVAAQVRQAARKPFTDLAGCTNLKELAAVLSRSAAHICGDTGSGHLAAALGTPVISLIGPTDPERACPYGQRHNAVSLRQFCGTHCGPHRCEFAAPRCMQAIEVSTVLAKLREVMGERICRA